MRHRTAAREGVPPGSAPHLDWNQAHRTGASGGIPRSVY